MKNTVLEKIKQKGHAVGIFHELGCMAAAECLGLSGLDFFIVDSEHGPFDVESAQLAILAAERHGCMPFARVRDTSRTAILKMLDVGAMGLIVPFIQSLEDVRQVVSYAKYAPVGNRGFAPTRASGYGHAPYASSIQNQFAVANREALLIPQCETVGCLEQVEEIAAYPGVDGLFVGPYDLSIAMGMPGEFENPRFQAAVSRVLQACKANGKLAFIYANTAEQAKARIAEGFEGIAVGMDTLVLISALKGMLASIS